MSEQYLAAIDWDVLRSRETAVPLEKLQGLVETVKASPGLIGELESRGRELHSDPYTVETFELVYIPYVLAQVAPGVAKQEGEEICRTLLSWLGEAGDLEDDALCEYLQACCKHVGPPILGALLELLEDPNFGPDEGGWFFAWSVAEVAARCEDEGIRDRVASTCIKAIERGLNRSADELASVAVITYVLALLDGRMLPLLEKAERRLRKSDRLYESISANDIKFTIDVINGDEKRIERREEDFAARLQLEVKAYDEWYRTRGPNWQDFADEEGESEPLDDARMANWMLDSAAARVVGPEPESMDPLASKRPIHAGPKVGRNELCPCGSGKKYKKCCLK